MYIPIRIKGSYGVAPPEALGMNNPALSVKRESERGQKEHYEKKQDREKRTDCPYGEGDKDFLCHGLIIWYGAGFVNISIKYKYKNSLKK